MIIEPVVYRRVPTCDPEELKAAAEFGMADLHEALGSVVGRQGLMSSHIKPLSPDAQCIGQAVTAYNYPGDNLLMHQALHLALPGQVLVVTNGGFAQGALFGEMAGHFAQQKGLAGVVVDGPVRDVAGLRKIGIPVWSTSISASHAEKRGPGSVNVPIVCDGALVEPGDIVVADADGVLVVPLSTLGEVVNRARVRAEKEVEFRRRLAEGTSLYELTNMAEAFAAAGIREVDGVWR